MDFIYLYELEQKEPLAIALSGAERGLRLGETMRANVTNVQYKPNQNCHYDSSLYNTCFLIKKFLNK
jgi:hypothetical protein